MSNIPAKLTAAYFESRKLDFMISDDYSSIVTQFELENMDGFNVFISFDEGDHTVNLRTSSLITFPETKMAEMYALANALNSRFRWIKFVVDEKDNNLIALDDAVIKPDSCGEEVFECSMHFAKIVDTAYPIIIEIIDA